MHSGRRRIISLAGVLSLALTGLVSVAAPSGAATDSPAATTIRQAGSLAAGTIITIPDGSKRTLPKNWGDMTVQDLAAIGIHPEMAMTRETAAELGIQLPEGMSKISPPKDRFSAAPKISPPKDRFSAAPANAVQPMNAGASDVDVTNYVWGGSGNITAWNTTGLWRGPAGYTYSGWWGPPGTLITTGAGTRTAGPGKVYSSANFVPFHVNQQTYLCNTWTGISGKPCVDAH